LRPRKTLEPDAKNDVFFGGKFGGNLIAHLTIHHCFTNAYLIFVAAVAPAIPAIEPGRASSQNLD
jgi:hypothetical protein